MAHIPGFTGNPGLPIARFLQPGPARAFATVKATRYPVHDEENSPAGGFTGALADDTGQVRSMPGYAKRAGTQFPSPGARKNDPGAGDRLRCDNAIRRDAPDIRQSFIAKTPHPAHPEQPGHDSAHRHHRGVQEPGVPGRISLCVPELPDLPRGLFAEFIRHCIFFGK